MSAEKPAYHDGVPKLYRKDNQPSSSRYNSPGNSVPFHIYNLDSDLKIFTKGVAGAAGVRNEIDQINLVGETIPINTQRCRVKERIICGGEEFYALESDIPLKSYDGRCPKCRSYHVHFEKPNRGYYALVKNIHDNMQNEKLANDRAKGPKEIQDLPIEKINLPPLDHPIIGMNKGIEGASNSGYMDSTIFCMFAYTHVFDLLIQMNVDKNPLVKDLQKFLRENIVNVLRNDQGFVGRDVLFHLRTMLSKATKDPSFVEMEKDPSEFLRAFEQLFHYAPLKTIPHDQLPNETGSNITTNIIWEMFDANIEKLRSTSIASIFRNSLVEIQAKLATIPPVLVLMAPRHSRSERSYRYIIPDREIILDHKIVQLVCVKCKKPNHDSEQTCEFYFCEQCYSNDSSSLSTPSIDTTFICYCHDCLVKLHKCLPEKDILDHCPKQMKNITCKLDLFAVLCIETSQYVAFVKCHKPDQNHEWLFFDSMSDRVQNEKNIPCVSSLPKFDRWIDTAEKDECFFEDLDRRRRSGKPTSQEFNEDEMRQLRLFRDGAFFFYGNPVVDYQ